MPIGNAFLKATDIRPEGVLLHLAEAQGIPVNGLNIVGIPFVAAGVDPNTFDEAYLNVLVRPLISGSSVAFATEGIHPTPLEVGGALSANKDEIALQIVQAGADEVLVQVTLMNSVVQ
jgi:hypothetical protein